MIDLCKCRESFLDKRSDERHILVAITLNTAGHIDSKRAHVPDCITDIAWVKSAR
jgi:hypothetical protein